VSKNKVLLKDIWDMGKRFVSFTPGKIPHRVCLLFASVLTAAASAKYIVWVSYTVHPVGGKKKVLHNSGKGKARMTGTGEEHGGKWVVR